MSNTRLDGAVSTAARSSRAANTNMRNLGSAAEFSCPVDRFLQTPFLMDTETDKWKVKGLKALYLLIQELLYAITSSFHAQLSTMPAPSADSNSNISGADGEPSKQFTCSSTASLLDIRLLEIYRSLFTACYTSKRTVETIAVSGQTQTSTPNGTDYASSEYEMGASSSLIQLSDHSPDSTAFVVSTHPGLGSCVSSDSTAFPSQISFDSSPVASELENIKVPCDSARLLSKADVTAVSSAVLVPPVPPIPIFTLAHAGLPYPGQISASQAPLDCIPISLLPVSVDRPTHKLSGISGIPPGSAIQKSLHTPSTIPMKQESCIPAMRTPSTPSLSTVTRQPCSRGHKETAAWSKEEDQLLEIAVGMFKAKNWRKIADFIYINGHNLPRRTADQCNQRWLRTIDPKITKGNWPAEEDMQLIAAVKVCPSRNWKAISALMPNRTDVQIRGRLQRLAPMLLERGILTADQLPPVSSNRSLPAVQSL
ncbi:Myb 1-like protein [Giardia lamblia P15]|uniref:Myb 1-like protein n=1 Tax=Giardia intestinalis (strain P15) TaxID=658858 RepID=E1F7J7_GIAIA|nr:Myb 1-like protein [Giardia lamblia P15]